MLKFPQAKNRHITICPISLHREQTFPPFKARITWLLALKFFLRERDTQKSKLQGTNFPVLKKPNTWCFWRSDIPAFSCSFVEFCVDWDSGRAAVCLGREQNEHKQKYWTIYLTSSPAQNTHLRMWELDRGTRTLFQIKCSKISSIGKKQAKRFYSVAFILEASISVWVALSFTQPVTCCLC